MVTAGRYTQKVIAKAPLKLYVLLSLKWITNKDLLCSTGNSAQCYVEAWKGGELGGE